MTDARLTDTPRAMELGDPLRVFEAPMPLVPEPVVFPDECPAFEPVPDEEEVPA